VITPADDRRAIHCALHDPPADNWTVPVELLPACEIHLLVHAFRLGQVAVDIAVANMAKGDRPIPDSRSHTAALARVTNSATRLTGTQTSCLIEPE
jgi:hypothetical protein